MRRSFLWQLHLFNKERPNFPDFQEMETTTLVTFMLHHPWARAVELLGSWDNFAEPYRMERDGRKGEGHWTGCHNFKDIICDGDLSELPSPKRSGGLKQGGTYWYYYRIDGVEEYHNPAEPSTTSCPFLPGQTLNVLDVPRQIQQTGSKSRSDSMILAAAVHTLDPDHRYLNPRPPPAPPAMRPKLPRLITPAVMDQIDHQSSCLDRPWTADVELTKDVLERMFPSPKRNIKSASGSPPSVLKMAFSHLKDLSPTLTPSNGGRGRSRTLHPSHARSERTHDPSIREFRMTWPPLATSPTSISPDAALEDTPSPIAESPMELAPNGQQLLPRKRKSLQRLLDVEEEPETIDMFPSTSSFHALGLPGSNADRRNRRGRSSDEYSSRRSLSQSRLQAPSPLRNVVFQDDARIGVRILDDIKEVDYEDLRSPRKQIESQQMSQSSIDVNKELTVLPSYSVPDPLFPYSTHEDNDTEMEATLASRFSLWSTASEDDPGSPVTDDNTASPTSSSIKGTSSSICTPNRLSPKQGSLDGFLSQEDFKNLSLESPEEDPFEALMDGKTPKAASFQLHQLHNGFPTDTEHPQAEVHAPLMMTQGENLLEQLEYLSAALV